jgi:hypothetical protein
MDFHKIYNAGELHAKLLNHFNFHVLLDITQLTSCNNIIFILE